MSDAMMPDPLTPPDCNLRGLPYLPLDTIRLMDSDLFALSTGDEFKAAVALWCKAWTQVPAASLPDDDRVLARLSGAGSNWREVREGALRGWVKCTDGRLYHPVVAEKAVAAWAHRNVQKARATKRWSRPNAADDAPAEPRQSHGNATAKPRQCHGNATAQKNDAAASESDAQAMQVQGKVEERKKEPPLVPPAPLAAEPRAEARAPSDLFCEDLPEDDPVPQPPDPPDSAPKAAKREKPRTRVPRDWKPSAAGVAYASERGVNPSEVLRFRNHHEAKGSTMASWDAAWRTWCDHAVEFGRAPGIRRQRSDSLAGREEATLMTGNL